MDSSKTGRWIINQVKKEWFVVDFLRCGLKLEGGVFSNYEIHKG